jgi:uncharacterized protein
MALVNHAKREIHAKLVMFGPAGSGKRTSLSYIYRKLKSEYRGVMRTMNIQKDKMVFFDFFPGSRSENAGYAIHYHLYTVTGPDVADSSWKMLLKAADGVMFVIDSAPEKMTENRASLRLLDDLLAGQGVSLQTTPLVFQCNKRDIASAVSIEALREAVSAGSVPVTGSVATSGEGVIEALFALVRMVQTHLGREGVDLIRESEQVVDELEMDEDDTAIMSAADNSFAPASASFNLSPEGKLAASCSVDVGGDVVPVPGGIRIPLVIRSGNSSKRVSLTVSFSLDQEQ